MTNPVLRSSEEWSKILDHEILDPDGWDRKNFVESWNELISEEEFWSRAAASTIYRPYRRGGSRDA